MSVTMEQDFSSGVSVENYKTLFGAHAGSVTILTAMVDDEPVGFTATSVVSVAADPPRIVFSINETSSCFDVFERASHIGVHFLGPEDVELASTFARHGADRFADLNWRAGRWSVPILPVSTIAIGEVMQRICVGSSVLYDVELVSVRGEAGREPLIYLGRAFLKPSSL